ncbi:MAG: hypothetical protein AAFV77_03980 [Planctomycetota bacterium]
MPSTTLAVLRATPRSVSSSSIVRGTWPSYSSTKRVMAAWMALALFRYSPIDLTYFSIFAGVAAT